MKKAALSIALMAGLFLISQTAGATLADLHLKAGVIRGISSSLRPRR